MQYLGKTTGYLAGFGSKIDYKGARVAQSVKRPTFDFGSGHDLTVHGIKPLIGLCADIVEPAWDSLSPSLSLFPPPKTNKLKIFFYHLFITERDRA